MRDAVIRRNNVKVLGEGATTLVFAHGLGCDQGIWRAVVERLSGEFRVVLFDHVGAGGSDRAAYDPARYGSLDGYTRDLVEVVEAAGGPAPVLVAHSISSTLGVLASVASPGIFSRMVMLSPSPRFVDDPPEYRGGFHRRDVDEFLELMDQNFLGWATAFSSLAAPDVAVARRLVEGFCAVDPRALRAFTEIALLSDVRALLPRVEAPAMIVQCDDDALAPPVVGEFMHRAMKGSTYRLVRVSGHFPHVSDAPLVASLVRGCAALGGVS